MLRDHQWHGRDLRLKFGAIRLFDDQELRAGGVRRRHLGPARRPAVRDRADGRAAHRPRRRGPAGTACARERPDILLTCPSNAVEIAREAARRGVALPPLHELRLFSEVVDPAARTFLRAAFGAPVTDTYTASDCATCCAARHADAYHVQAENVLLEVLDGDGRACAPGQVGRVVISTLHNLAMPLLRCEIGDHAEVGAPCACGRGLPTLTRVLGAPATCW